MVEMVHARKSAETKEERYDLFSGLLDAAQDDPDGSVAITEKELIGQSQLSCVSREFSLVIPGNMFIFLLAGHEIGPPHSTHDATTQPEPFLCCRRHPIHSASLLPY